jgi:hypothetical protein
MGKDTLDQKVRELYDIIQSKKAQIAKMERPSYKTNLSYVINENVDNVRINLQVVNDVNVLVKILAQLNILRVEYENICFDLNLKCDFKYSGYSYDDWKHDITSMINKINIKKEKDDLATKEAKLNTLISPEEKRRLDIEALSKELEL